MLLPGIVFFRIVVAIHVIVAVVALGVLVAYPLIAVAAERSDRRSVPTLHRVRVTVGRSLVNPGLLLVVAAGVYLTIDHHLWQRFYVQWGIGAVLVLGGLEGALVIRQSKQLAELSERDVAAAPAAGEVSWSDEYLTLRARSDQINAAMAMLVIVTAFLMVIR